MLFLLDHGVNPDKISWVVPNDAWFWDRYAIPLDEGNTADKVALMTDAIIDEKVKTSEEALVNLEDAGILMRLDKNILPTRYRAATISQAEITKLQKVKNIIRKGRIESIEPGKLVFQSGEEMSVDPKTIHVDCSANSTLFAPAKKVFDGKTINVQFILLPPPSLSANIIAAMELKYPEDEEKKNSVCHVLTAPQMPEDFAPNFHVNNLTNKAAIEELGLMWQRKRRSSSLYHVAFFDLIKLMYNGVKTQEALMKKLELLMEEKQKS